MQLHNLLQPVVVVEDHAVLDVAGVCHVCRFVKAKIGQPFTLPTTIEVRNERRLVESLLHGPTKFDFLLCRSMPPIARRAHPPLGFASTSSHGKTALRGPSLGALHPQHPQPCAPWPLQPVGHLHLPSKPIPRWRVDRHLDFIPFTLVPHPTFSSSSPAVMPSATQAWGAPLLPAWPFCCPQTTSSERALAAGHAVQRGQVRSVGPEARIGPANA